MYMYIYIYTYTHNYICICIYVNSSLNMLESSSWTIRLCQGFLLSAFTIPVPMPAIAGGRCGHHPIQ